MPRLVLMPLRARQSLPHDAWQTLGSASLMSRFAMPSAWQMPTSGSRMPSEIFLLRSVTLKELSDA